MGRTTLLGRVGRLADHVGEQILAELPAEIPSGEWIGATQFK